MHMDTTLLDSTKLHIQKQIKDGVAFREIATGIGMSTLSNSTHVDDLIDMIVSAMAGAQQKGKEICEHNHGGGKKMNSLLSYRINPETDKRELIQIIAVLVDALGGKFVFTREVIEKMLDDKGELKIDNDFSTMSTIITYRNSRIEPPDIGNTRQ
jgi:hypothetical protein